MIINWPEWFASRWRLGQRRRVLDGYRAFGATYKETLADIALRNFVFTPAPEGDAIALAIVEGRRQCALEIVKLANIDHLTLWQQIEKKEPPNASVRQVSG